MAVTLISGCGKFSSTDVQDNRFLLDTIVSIRLYNSSDEDLLNRTYSLIESYEQELSRYHPESEVTRINSSAADTDVPVSENTLSLLESALKYASISGGVFDPTVGPLVDLWGIGGDSPGIPETRDIKEALERVDYSLMQVGSHTVRKLKDNMILDLGGIAKGWIADRVAEFLQNNGVDHALINLGGNVRIFGGKPGGKPYKIGIQDPFDERGNYLGILTISNGSVVSSGIYERYFMQDGIRYHHILDTSSGVPVNNGLAAVTVISDESIDGDALSTTLFALGLDEGMELAQSLAGIEAVFVSMETVLHMTEGAEKIFELSDNTERKVHVYQTPESQQ